VGKLFGKSKLAGKELSAEAISLLPALFQNLVVTTNFEVTIEEVYQKAERHFGAGVILPERTEALNAFLRGEGSGLFKVHGTMLGERAEYQNLIFTRKSYENVYQEGTEFIKNLKKVFERRTLLFLGCGLEEDRTVDLMKTVMEDGMENYAILSCPPEKRDERRRELNDLHIRAILYDPGADKSGHNAVRIILEKLLEDTDNPAYQKLKKDTIAETPLNRFMFNAGSTDFAGREAEMAALRAFMDVRVSEPHRFRWWALVGPGGAGKSRIAWELEKEYKKNGWDVVLLRRKDYENLDTLAALYTGNTLFVADYVQQYTARLGKWMDGLTQNARSSQLRLLLVERDTDYKDGTFPWEKQILDAGNRERLRRTRHEERFLFLPRPEPETIISIAESFARYLGTPLPPDGTKLVLEALERVDGELLRPLYAMALTDALCHGKHPERWSREDVLDYVVDTEKQRLLNDVRALYSPRENDEELNDALQRLWTVATVLQDVSYYEVETLCPDVWDLLKERRRERRLKDARDLL
ncbi:MAG: SIR2 family protein, partial [bacterium]